MANTMLHTPDDQARKVLQRAFLFADIGFEHIDFRGSSALSP